MRKYFLVIGFVAIDLISKSLAIRYLPIVYNDGIAFGIDVPFWLLVSIHTVLIPTLAFFLYKNTPKNNFFAEFSLSLIIGGALGNYIDRLWHGHVIDFINLQIWPVFNLADTFIVCGVLLMLIFHAKIEGIKKHE